MGQSFMMTEGMHTARGYILERERERV